eukprot:3137661-Pyramimonas_sp.AAC.1
MAMTPRRVRMAGAHGGERAAGGGQVGGGGVRVRANGLRHARQGWLAGHPRDPRARGLRHKHLGPHHRRHRQRHGR